jgi:hypothetical protein
LARRRRSKRERSKRERERKRKRRKGSDAFLAEPGLTSALAVDLE